MDFEEELWRFRSQVRHDRLVEAGKTDRAKEQLAQDELAIMGLKAVVDWCKKARLSVTFTRTSNGSYYQSKKLIKISCNGLPQSQLFWLLHECGHHISAIDVTSHAKPKERLPDRRSLQKTKVVCRKIEHICQGSNFG